MSKKFLVLVPTYNEGENLKKVVRQLARNDYPFCVINDGSSDGTREFLEEHQFQHINHDENLGQGTALRSGFNYALQQQYKIVVHFDGDGQHRFEDIMSVVNTLEKDELDIVFGSRFLNPDYARHIPFLKRQVLKIARIFEGIRTGIWLSDAHCGLRGLRVSSCQHMHFAADRMAHASEIVTETKRLQLRYDEVPILAIYRKTDRQSSVFSRIISVLKELYRTR